MLTHISFLIKRRRAIHNLWFETLRNLRQLADKQARQVDMINMRRLNEEHMVGRSSGQNPHVCGRGLAGREGREATGHATSFAALEVESCA